MNTALENLDWLQFMKQFFINVSYHILVASLTLVALFFSHEFFNTVISALSSHSEKTKIGFQDRLSLNAGQNVLQNAPREHSAILPACIKLPSVFKTFVLFISEWPLKTGFTVYIQSRRGEMA